MSREKTAPPVQVQIRTATPSSVRAVNRSIVLELIRRRQPISRAELARITGIFRSSVSDIVDELIAEDLVTEERSTPSRPGRVPMSLRLNDSGYCIMGVNIRPVYSQIAYAGLSGRILKTLNFETPTSPNKLVQAIAQAVKRLSDDSVGVKKPRFRRIGIAIPGHVDVTNGRILWTPTHQELNGFPIAAEIEKHTGIEALADNDCNVGALSELWLGTDEKSDRGTDFVFLNVSDFGTGAGVVLNREIYLGHDAHFVAEVGHMVVDPSGPLCRCGRHGCWELFVSNDAMWRRVHPRSTFSVEGFNELLSAAKQGQSKPMNSLRETTKYLSLGISNIAFIFNPAEIIVAGRITAVWDLIHQELESLYGSPQLHYSLRPARLSADDSLLHGAICLALRDTFARPHFGHMSLPGQQSA